MAKTKISQFSSTAADNTDITNINIAEGCSPANVNNAIRSLMALLKDQQAGTNGDPFTVGSTLAVTGSSAFTGTLVASAGIIANITGNVTGNLTGNVTGNVTGNINGTVGATTPNTGTFTTLIATSIPNLGELVTVSATASTGTINYDVKTQGILYYTTNASGNFTLNFRGDGSTTLNTFMATGETRTVTFLSTQGSTAYYNSAVTIDGTSVTPKWQGGSAPTAGNASGIDVYTYSIIKTASATYTVLASQTQFK